MSKTEKRFFFFHNPGCSKITSPHLRFFQFTNCASRSLSSCTFPPEDLRVLQHLSVYMLWTDVNLSSLIHLVKPVRTWRLQKAWWAQYDHVIITERDEHMWRALFPWFSVCNWQCALETACMLLLVIVNGHVWWCMYMCLCACRERERTNSKGLRAPLLQHIWALYQAFN